MCADFSAQPLISRNQPRPYVGVYRWESGNLLLPEHMVPGNYTLVVRDLNKGRGTEAMGDVQAFSIQIIVPPWYAVGGRGCVPTCATAHIKQPCTLVRLRCACARMNDRLVQALAACLPADPPPPPPPLNATSCPSRASAKQRVSMGVPHATQSMGVCLKHGVPSPWPDHLYMNASQTPPP